MHKLNILSVFSPSGVSKREREEEEERLEYQIYLPGCDIDLDFIKRELERVGESWNPVGFLQRRRYFTEPSHNRIAKSALGYQPALNSPSDRLSLSVGSGKPQAPFYSTHKSNWQLQVNSD